MYFALPMMTTHTEALSRRASHARIYTRHVLAAAAFLLPSALLSAQGTASVKDTKPNPVAATLIAEHASVQPGRAFWVGVMLTMQPEWHTYWRNPGDAGMATSIVWDLPPGFTAEPIQWPVPHLLDAPPTVSYGYEQMVLFPVRITPSATASGTAVLRARVSWLACKQLCLPGSATVAWELPVSAAAPAVNAQWRDAFTTTRSRLPTPLPGSPPTARIEGDSIVLVVSTVDSLRAVLAGEPYFFAAEEAVMDHSATQRAFAEGGRLRINMHASSFATTTPDTLRGVLAYMHHGHRKAYELSVPVTRKE